MKETLAKVDRQLKDMANQSKQWQQLQNDLELKQHEGELLQTRIEQSTHFQVQAVPLCTLFLR